MKKILNILLLLFGFSLVGCALETEAVEEITYTGLEEIISYVGDDIDLMSGVTFTSSTRGDITNLVTTTVYEGETYNINDANVCMMVYSVDYENGEPFTANRRITIKNEVFVSNNNLIDNGGFDNDPGLDLHFHGHIDYPQDVFFSIHTDLELLQFQINSVTESDEYPFYIFNKMSLDSTKTYQLSLLIKGNPGTTIRMDVAKIPVTTYSVDNTVIVDAFNVVAPAASPGMTIFTTTFSPSETTDDAYLRIILGSTTEFTPTDQVYIDNLELIEMP